MMSPEEYVQRHKKAFRIAFDYLNAHFPPDGMEWWEKTALDASEAYMESGNDPLALQLVAGVCNYLEGEWKRRNENAGESSA